MELEIWITTGGLMSKRQAVVVFILAHGTGAVLHLARIWLRVAPGARLAVDPGTSWTCESVKYAG